MLASASIAVLACSAVAANDLKRQLRKQLAFIQRSAESFDRGEKDEAVRIATCLRIIFHQTARSTCLLEGLKAWNVEVRSNVPEPPETPPGMRAVEMFRFSLATVKITPQGATLGPSLDLESPHRQIVAAEWWMESFAFLDGIDHTRKDLVLAAANKDGGAHVDLKLPASYRKLSTPGALGLQWKSNGNTVDFDDVHLNCLRSMAFEVLSSKGLRRLAELEGGRKL